MGEVKYIDVDLATLVSNLEEILEDARKGRFKAFTMSFIDVGGVVWSAYDGGDDVFAMIGAVESVKTQMLLDHVGGTRRLVGRIALEEM